MGGLETFASLGLALFAGLVIGFEREQASAKRTGPPDSFLGGARTHPLVALVGAVSMLLSRQAGPAVPVLALVGLLAFLLVAYYADLRREGGRGITSEIAFILTFGLGALSVSNEVVPALRERVLVVASVAIVATLLLSVKPALHSLVAHVSSTDLYATLKFLVVSVVVVPLLPDETFGPFDAVNPRKTGLLVVLISGLSFIGYVGMRVLGPRRGIGLSGLVGGLVSSTAVTLAFSGRAKEEPGLASSCAVAVVLASSIMFARMLILVGVVSPGLVPTMALPLGLSFSVGLLASALLLARSEKTAPAPAALELANPVELGSAVKFAAFFTFVLVASKAATSWFGARAAYPAALLAGATDVDAITLSLARLGAGGLQSSIVSTAILLGAASNTLVKAGMAIAIGGWSFGRRVLLAFTAMLAAGGLCLAWMWLA